MAKRPLEGNGCPDGKLTKSVENLRNDMDGQEFCQNLDHLTIDISCTAPWHQRHWYENTIMLVSNDDDGQAAPMRARKDVKSTTQTLTNLRQEQGRHNSCMMAQPQLENLLVANFLFIIFTTIVAGNTNTKTLDGANSKTLNGEITSGGKSDGYRLFQIHVDFFHRFRVQTLANAVHATESEDRTPRRTHILLCVEHI